MYLKGTRIRMKPWLTTLIWHNFTIITLFISFPFYCAQNTQYIKPTADAPCPGEPCYTLFQYAEQNLENFSSNITLVFLPGDHTLNLTISVGTLSNSWDGSRPGHYTIPPLPSLYLEAPPPFQRSLAGYAHGQLVFNFQASLNCTSLHWPSSHVDIMTVQL